MKQTQLLQIGIITALCILAFGIGVNRAARADANNPTPAVQTGSFHGAVLDAASGKPVADATVAVENKDGKVIAWTKTDAQGQYRIDADTLKVLDLEPSRHRGFLADLGRGIVTVVNLPVKAVGAVANTTTDVVKEVDPIGTMKSVAVSGITSNPAPLAGQAARDMENVATSDASQKARQSAISVIQTGHTPSPQKKKDADTLLPGEVMLAVSAPGHQELHGKADAYWLEAGSADSGSKSPDAQAWLASVSLAPAPGSKKSGVEKMAVLLANPTLDPALAPAGSPVKISVQLQAPAAPPLKLRVVAREDKTHTVVELTPQGKNLYAGSLTLDPKTPIGDTIITIAALHAQPIGQDLSKDAKDPLLDFAANLDALDAGKPYHFDPRVMASENRIDLKMTVLDPKQETPPSPAAAPAKPVPAPTAPAKPAPPTPAPSPAAPAAPAQPVKTGH